MIDNSNFMEKTTRHTNYDNFNIALLEHQRIKTGLIVEAQYF